MEIGIYWFWIRSTLHPSGFTLVLRIGKPTLAKLTGFQASWQIVGPANPGFIAYGILNRSSITSLSKLPGLDVT